MAAYCGRPTCVAITVLLLQLAVYAKATNNPFLEILPIGGSDNSLLRPVHSSLFVTCKPRVDNLQLVQNLQWFDPQDRVIDPVKKDGQMPKPDVYTEIRTGDRTVSLVFNSLEEKHAGKYICKGTYSTIPIINSTTINPFVGITWDNAPENQYPILGEDYAIQCQVRARPSPVIIWLYNGVEVQTNDHYIIEPYSLKIKKVQESDDGIYSCRATVQLTGEMKTRDIRVEVHIRPTIEEVKSPVMIIEGENTNINCKAKGKPPPTISWIKSLTQQNLSNIDRFGVNPVTGVLTINNVQREDAGEYQCIAENRANITKANIQISVIVKPKIMEFENKTAVEGNLVEIKCKAFGRPAPYVCFRKFTAEKAYQIGNQNERIVMLNKINDSAGETIGILQINPVLIDNDGLYECLANNSGGYTYKNGHLTVEFPPSFRNMPNVTVWSWDQRPVNLTCIAESIPNATIEWTRYGDQKIINDPALTQIGNGPISILNIRPTDRRYYSNYKCIASNKHGVREHLMELREARRPEDLRQVKMIEITATTIKFDLIPPETKDLPIETISVQYRENNGYQQWPDAKNKTWVVGSVYVIEHLKPQTSYEFRFAVGNQVGMSNWGSNHFETMPSKTVPNEPRFVTKSKEMNLNYEISPYNNQYELSWVTPPDNGEVIDKYLIKYCQTTPKFEVLENTCDQLEVNSYGRTRQYIKGLRSDTYYRAELQAHNAMGYSKPGFINFKTDRGVDSVLQHQGPLLSNVVIVGIVVGAGISITVAIDFICCWVRKSGIFHYIRERFREKHPMDEEDAKLGRDEKEPLNEEKKITPIIDSGLRRETSVTFDGKRSVSKTGFVGKDSAV